MKKIAGNVTDIDFFSRKSTLPTCPMVPLVGKICTIGTNLIANGTIGKEIGANGKNGNTIGTNGTNVTNQWYRWENSEHTHGQCSSSPCLACCLCSANPSTVHFALCFAYM